MTHPQPRESVRLLLLAPDRRVLLLRYDNEGQSFWAPAGGGLEPGESIEDAARREALEELGLVLPDFEPLWSQTVEFTFRRQPLRVLEHFALVRLGSRLVAPDARARQAQREEGILEMRWWTAEEIERTPERVFPSGLAGRLRQLL